MTKLVHRRSSSSSFDESNAGYDESEYDLEVHS